MIAHYDEEALVALLDGGAESDAHLAACAECRESFDEFRNLTASLSETSVWDPALPPTPPNPQTIANLRAYADAQQTEDEAAVPLVAVLLAGPREEWMPRLQSDAKYRTVGVVRKLMEASDKAIDVMPPDALEISALATEIADKLEPESYPSDTVMKLRGNAWRDRGYFFFYVGRLKQAAQAFSNSETALQSCRVSEYEQGRLSIASAFNARAQENLESSLAFSYRAQFLLERFDDCERTVAAGVARAHALMKSGRAAEALTWLRRLLGMSERVSGNTLGRLMANIGYAYREIGDVNAALDHFKIAGEILEDANASSERLRVEQNVAELLLINGKLTDAEQRLRILKPQFDERHMIAESTSAALSIAEVSALRGDFDEVERLCEDVLASLRSVGAENGIRARTAISLLQENAAARKATVSEIRRIRQYVRDALRERLFFAALPAE